jgi:23S rRNA (uracil1939-C5)-methyltransferase
VSAEADLDIESIAAGGDGVARHEGLVIFVPRAATGDRIRAAYTTDRRLGRGKLKSIIVSSPVRIEPPCPHYVIDRCGGCQVQHMTYDAQLAAKAAIIHDSLTRIGKRTVIAPIVAPSPAQWRYRKKLTMAMRRRAGRWYAGLHPYDAPDVIFDLKDCPITDERVVSIWGEIMNASGHFPNADRLRGAVRMLANGASFVLEGGARWDNWRRFLDAAPSVKALWWVPLQGQRRLLADHDGRTGASFAQVNAAMASELHRRVVERTSAHAPSHVVDAYAGTGVTAAAIARQGVRVTAIEADRDAARQCASLLPPQSRSIAGRVETELASALPADVLIVNPPRTGLDSAIPPMIESSAPRVVIYVSCNPATLARDLQRLPSYRIAALEAFDMFPQTAHVETLCELVAA